MKVVIYFDRETRRTKTSLSYVMYGKYGSSGFMFVGDTDVTCFGPLIDSGFGSTVFQKRSAARTNYYDTVTDYLLLGVDEDEGYRLLSSCQACVQTRKAFNLHDLLLIHVPFREPREISLYDTTTLNNTQAVILILRECLNQDNRLRQGLEGLHSRQTYTETLYDRLRPYALPVLWTALVDLVKWSDDNEEGGCVNPGPARSAGIKARPSSFSRD